MTNDEPAEFVIDVEFSRALRYAVIIGLALPLIAISLTLVAMRQLVDWWPAQLLLGVLLALLGVKAAQRAGLLRAIVTYRGLRQPPRMTRQGLLLKVFDPAQLTLVPWSQISRLSITQRTGRGLVLVQVRDPAAIARGQTRLIEVLDQNQIRHGAPILLWLEGASVTPDQIAEAAQRLSGGRVQVDHGPDVTA